MSAKDAEIACLKAENAALKKEVSRLRAKLNMAPDPDDSIDDMEVCA